MKSDMIIFRFRPRTKAEPILLVDNQSLKDEIKELYEQLNRAS